jgi:hypothetical protein
MANGSQSGSIYCLSACPSWELFAEEAQRKWDDIGLDNIFMGPRVVYDAQSFRSGADDFVRRNHHLPTYSV